MELARQVVVVGRLGVEVCGKVGVIGIVEVLGMLRVEVPGVETMVEMGGKQLTMVGKQLQMGKQQVRRAHPCQSSSNSRTRTCGRQLWAMAIGWTWTRRGRSRFSKRCARVSA